MHVSLSRLAEVALQLSVVFLLFGIGLLIIGPIMAIAPDAMTGIFYFIWFGFTALFITVFLKVIARFVLAITLQLRLNVRFREGIVFRVRTVPAGSESLFEREAKLLAEELWMMHNIRAVANADFVTLPDDATYEVCVVWLTRKASPWELLRFYGRMFLLRRAYRRAALTKVLLYR